MKVKIDKDKCYKSGECYYNHPELFQMDEDGFPRILVENIEDEDLIRQANEAIEVCPAVAIYVDD